MQPKLRMRHFYLYGVFPLICLVTLLGYLVGYLRVAHAQTTETPAPITAQSNDSQTNTASAFYLPFVFNDINFRLSKRIGYGATTSPITRYPDIRSLNAGWYVDWSVRVAPPTPGGMDFVQMIRLHQKIVETNGCGIHKTPDRDLCPYVVPHAYEYAPDAATIQAAAIANPGDTWLIGNEPDRRDWSGGGQDEMLPELYAVAYKELYDLIKAADPTAKVAIAGVIQATPMRLDYLTKVWNEYRRLYNSDMPVDVWNVHNFILAEVCQIEDGNEGKKNFVCYGAGTPPGSEQLVGSYHGQDWTHIDRTIFDQQIRAFRQWMKDRGQETKPLLVTEYGVLYSKIECARPIPGGCQDPWVDLEDPQVIQEFMLWSFDYFLNTKDCALSSIDDCRLVQQWLWFSLDHIDPVTNQHPNLFDRDGLQILPAGEKFRDYTNQHYQELSRGY